MASNSRSSDASRNNGKSSKADTRISFKVDQNSYSGISHRMIIDLTSTDGITRVDAAYMSPSGSTGIQKAKRIESSSYEVMIKSPETGEFKISIAAYGRGEVLGFTSSKYTLNEPNGYSLSSSELPAQEPLKVKKKSVPSIQAELKVKKIRIPKPPPEIKTREIKSWPISGAYTKALQNLNFSISQDYQDLKDGKVLLNPNVKFSSYIHGSGNFGIVFKLDVTGQYHALKCFTRAAPDIAVRYYYLSAYLSRISLPFLVNFKYLTGAVRVLSDPKEFYPALLMDWVEGQNVNQFIEKYLDSPSVILNFANNFIGSVHQMQSMNIAHGDLSGDNIMVGDAGNLTYLDYDGMYIPQLAGRNPPEKGHENFQHPKRTREYGINLDNFSALVIYLTAVAVAEDKKIWKYNGGDMDRMIFTSSDFKDPSNSQVIRALSNMSKRTRKLSKLLSDFLDKGPLWEGASPKILMNL